MDDDDERARRESAASNGGEDVEMLPSEHPMTAEETNDGARAVAENEPSSGDAQTHAVHASEDVAVDEREVLFLIANYLEKREESKQAAQALIADLSTSDLLGESVAWNGGSRPATYADYKRRHRDLGPDHLLHLLKGALNAKPAGTMQAASANTKANASTSLLLKSRVLAHRKVLTPAERKAIQTEIIDKTMHLRKLQRTETLVTRIVRKYDRLLQFVEDSQIDSLPADVRDALATQSSELDSTNVTALAADVRAVKQLLQVREEKAAVRDALYRVLERATNAGALQSTARTGRNHLSLLHRREISMRAPKREPPAHIYSRIRRLKTLSGHLQIAAYCMTYDKTGKFVITGADDRLIKIWSLHTGDLCFTLRGHVGNITDLAVNSSNTLLASSSDDKTVRVWELSTGAPVAVLLGHSSVVNSVRFHPSKNIVVTASDDGHCFCYRLPDIAKCDDVESKEQTAKRLLDQGAYLLTLRPAYSLSHSTNRPNVRSNKVLCLNFSRCGNYVVTGGQDGVGRVWDVSEMCDANNQVAAADFQVGPQDTLRVISPQTAVTDSTVAVQDNANPPSQIAIGNEQVAVEQAEVNGEMAVTMDVVVANESTPALDEVVLIPPAQNPQAPIPAPIPAPVAAPIPVPVQPASQNEVRQQPQLPEVHQSRQAVVDIEQVHVINKPIAFLEGHTGPVTNILFNHRGDKMATASIKDGTTRVWRWERKYKKVTHKVLFDKEHDRDRELEMLYGISSRKRTPPAVDTLVWTRDDSRLITLHSTKPSSGTGEGDWRQRMRVWNPETGNLEMTLAALDREKKNGHVNAVFAMDVHPTDCRIVVTAGHDGRVFLWDISEGRILKSFIVTSPEGETVALLDGSFMPTGDGFCFTDRIGRLCIFGTGSGENLAAAPPQQYFHSDYAALITDRHFHVIDRETQRAPSLMESGPLMDVFRVAYPHQPPHLLASRGALTNEHYEENRRKRVQQCSESETTCKVRHNPDDEALVEDDFPLAILRPATVENDIRLPPQLATGAYRLNGDAVFQSELLRRASWNRRRRAEQQTRRRASATSDERDTSILTVDISSEEDHSDEDFQVPQDRRAGGDEDDDDDDDEDEDEDDDEDSELDEDDVPSDASDAPEGDRLRRRRARQNERQFSGRGRRLNGNDDDDDDENENGEMPGRRLRRRRIVPRPRLIGDEDDEGMDEQTAAAVRFPRSQSIGSNDSAPDAVVVESNDGVIMGDNTLDKFDTSMTYESMLEAKRAQQPAGSNASNAALIVCSFCGEGDDGGFLRLPGQALGKHPLISGTQRLFVHDQCAIASPLCFNHGGNWYNVMKEVRRGRSLPCTQCKKRGATIGCTIERCPKSYHWKCALACGWSNDQIQFYCPEHAQNGQGQSSGGADTEVQQRLALTFHREWLQLPSLVGVHPYVPQTGDYVVYFPEGHAEFLNSSSLKEPAFLRQLSRFVSLKCRIVDVKYRFPSLAVYHKGEDKQKAIHCEVTLAVLAVPTAAFPDLCQDEEEKEEADRTSPDATTLFIPDAPFFSKFTGVNQFLQPTAVQASERMQIKLLTFSNDVSNFIVLDHVFEAGISGDWRVGQRVRAPIVALNQGLQVSSNMSFGTIEAITARQSTENPSVITPWNSVFVRWDAVDEDDCSVSPWELEPATAVETTAKRERERNLLSVKLYRSRTLSQAQRTVLAEAISGVIAMDFAKDFVYPVDAKYVDYMVTVANPIDLTKIHARVTNGYYRQLDAFIADVELLLENCETYNVSTSPIAHNARSVKSSLLTSLQQFSPEFFASREATNGNLRHYPPIDFGSNDDEVMDIVETSFEEEQQIDDAMAALDGLPFLPPSDPEPSIDTPPQAIRLTRAMAVQPASTEVVNNVSSMDSPRPTRRSAAAATATPTPERRPKRELPPTILPSPDPPKSARKRQRPSDEPRLLKFADLMSSLTAEQRQLFEDRAAEDLPSLLRDFHEALIGADVNEVFAQPVSEEIAPGYHDVIKEPMDFGTILDSIEQYARFSRYFADVELVFSNAIAFNSWEGFIGDVVKELQDISVKLLLDAIGANSKRKARGRSRHPLLETPSRAKANGTPKRKRRAVSDDDDDEEEADSWESEESDSNDDDDDDEEDDDDDESEDASDGLSEPESDWSGGGRGRRTRLVRGDAKKKARKTSSKREKKRFKKSKKPAQKKRGRPPRR